MNDQFKIELQSLLARYPDIQSVTVKMVQTFEVKASTGGAGGSAGGTGHIQNLPPILPVEAVTNPTMAALLAGEREILKNK